MTVRTCISTYPEAPWAVPASTISAGRYVLRFARTGADLDRILRLRYEVYNLELGAGLEASHADGRDEDEFDPRIHHLLVEERDGAVVGTYRLQTAEMAERFGWQCAGLFEVDALPAELLAGAVELGRACIAKPHRNNRVLQLLWRGLAGYLLRNRKTVLFGCCALGTTDQSFALGVHRHLEKLGAIHRTLRVRPQAEAACLGGPAGAGYPTPRIPALFQAYLTLGARVLGPPAVDRAFKTIDWLALLDTRELDPITHRTFFR
jgi:putative hemolysin